MPTQLTDRRRRRSIKKDVVSISVKLKRLKIESAKDRFEERKKRLTLINYNRKIISGSKKMKRRMIRGKNVAWD